MLKLQDKKRSKSKSHHNFKDMECYNCGKKGPLKKYCQSTNKDKEKKQDKGKKK